MRLIDADALKEDVEFQQENMWPEDLSRRIPGMIDNAPTIYAIPVEWLEDMMLNSTKELSVAAWRVLNKWHPHDAKAWQKEQEAR